MLRKLSKAALICAALGLTMTTAQAHPRLQMSIPAAGSTLASSPTKITMSFSEGLIGRFAGLVLKDSHGKSMPTGQAMVDSNDNTKLMVPIKARLMAGTYNVAWHAVSVDTHRVSGKYSFRVAR